MPGRRSPSGPPRRAVTRCSRRGAASHQIPVYGFLSRTRPRSTRHRVLCGPGRCPRSARAASAPAPVHPCTTRMRARRSVRRLDRLVPGSPRRHGAGPLSILAARSRTRFPRLSRPSGSRIHLRESARHSRREGASAPIPAPRCAIRSPARFSSSAALSAPGSRFRDAVSAVPSNSGLRRYPRTLLRSSTR